MNLVCISMVRKQLGVCTKKGGRLKEEYHSTDGKWKPKKKVYNVSIDSEERDQLSKNTVDLSLTSGSDKSNDGNEKKEKRDKKEKNARSTGTHKKTK